MTRPGPRNAITDVAGLSVGQAHDTSVRTGVSVVLADQPAIAAVTVAGGGPGTRETDLLAHGTLVDRVDAIVLSGGSAFGLGAADGVADGLKAMGRGFGLIPRPGVPPTPIVPAAILYDLANGGDKTWTQSPYPALGRRALDARGHDVSEGRFGAGHGARAGALPGGIGTASWLTAEGISVGALVAVNSFGAVRMPGCEAYWAWPHEWENEFGGARPPAGWQMSPEDWGQAKANPAPRENTTLAIVATDATLTPSEAKRFSQMAIAGLARSIRPVFAPFDGDVVFALSTAIRPMPAPEAYTLARLGELAASALARAVARAVHHALAQDDVGQ